MSNQWRSYFAAAIPAAALVEHHSIDAMTSRAADIADAMMRVDEKRAPKSPDEIRAAKEAARPSKPPPTPMPSSGAARQDGRRRG